MKCETPARASGSSREPAPIQNPSATERTPGTRSEMTRSPVASSLRLVLRHRRIVAAGGASLVRGTSSWHLQPIRAETHVREPQPSGVGKECPQCVTSH